MSTEQEQDASGYITLRCPVCGCKFLNCYTPTEAQCLACEAFINTETGLLL